jgi:hypothetical protein
MEPLRGAVVLFKVGVLLLAGATHLGAATLDDAQRLFYTALFQESAAAAKSITDAEPENLAAWEVRTSALHFQLRRLLGEPKDRKAAMAKCAECRALLATFLEDVNTGRTAARARIAKAPDDEEARFFLGKLDLSYLWMQLSTLGKRPAGTNTGKPSASSKPCSRRTRCMCAPGWRGRGWTTSSARASPGARAG